MARHNKEQIALDLVCSTSKEVCERNKISETTLYRLRNDTAFMELVETFKQAMYGETMRKAQA